MLEGIRIKSPTVMTVSVNFGVSVGKLVFPSRKSTKKAATSMVRRTQL